MSFNKLKRKAILEKMESKCGYCGEELLENKFQIDHIIPQGKFFIHVKNKYMIPEFLTHLEIGDVDHMDNLLPTCAVCNRWKNNFDLELFRSELSEQIKRLNQYSSNYRIAKKYGQLTENENPIVFYFETLTKSTEP